MEPVEISTSIEQAMRELSPAVGTKVQSEEQLATKFGIGRHRVRAALDQLVQKGLLVRKRGSGTYVRSLPGRSGTDRSDRAMVRSLDIQMEDLFVTTPPGPDRAPAARPVTGTSLRIGLWSDLQAMPPAHHMVLAGLSQRAGETGNRLSVHSVVERRHVPLPPAELRRMVAANPCDVHIVAERWAELFLEASATEKAAVLFFNSSRPTYQYEPIVGLDNEGGVEMAVAQCAAVGHQRIGIILLEIPGHPTWEEAEAYKRAMRRADLDYRAVVTAGLEEGEAATALDELLAREDAPEAIYVADDHLLPEVDQRLRERGITPGRDLAIISLANAGFPLPGPRRYSRLEFDPAILGETIADSAIRLARRGIDNCPSVLLRPRWIPGETHCLRRAAAEDSEA